MVNKLLYAKELRKHSTEAEKLLWRNLRNRQLGDVKFRRQHPLGHYIVDFVSMERKLIIEIDGGQHAEAGHQLKDKRRDQYFQEKGFKVLRFWSNEVFHDLTGVLEKIRMTLG